jgi:uncharacterized Rmd1/YagE family protein
MSALFSGRDTIDVKSLLLAQRINMKALRQVPRLAEGPLVIEAGDSGCAVIFRYGAVVLFGLRGMEEAAFLSMLQPYIIEPLKEPEIEETSIIIRDSAQDIVEYDGIRIRNFEVERLQVIADVLAKSAALNLHEKQISETLDRIEPMAGDLQNGRRLKSGRMRDILSHIGATLSIQRRMAGQLEIGDKPEILWDAPPELTKLFNRLEDEYELQERHGALKEKLDLIYRTAETMLGLLQDRRSMHVEWYIVGLIMIEIILTLSEKFGIW